MQFFLVLMITGFNRDLLLYDGYKIFTGLSGRGVILPTYSLLRLRLRMCCIYTFATPLCLHRHVMM